MGRDSVKANENMCFQCRKRAAEYNDKLSSREGAAELLGVSVSSLADYELGLTKILPVDKVVLMADAYNAPELKIWYCQTQCPIGRDYRMPSPELNTVERATLNLLKRLRGADIQEVKDKLIDITADGVITGDEKVTLQDIMNFLDDLIQAAGELKLVGSKYMNEGAKND